MTIAETERDSVSLILATGEPETKFENRFVSLTDTPVRFPDGSEGTYVIVRSGAGFGGITIPRFVSRGTVYYGLVEQHRFPIGAVTLEFPRGGTDSLSAGEALRELAEETGVDTSEVAAVHLGNIHPDTGLLSTLVAVWLATVTAPADVNYIQPDTGASARWVHEGDLLGLIKSGKITCGMTLAAFAKLSVSSHYNVPFR